MTDPLDTLDREELSLLTNSEEVCSIGPATGLSRASAVSALLSPLRLRRPVADSLLRNLEPTRHGTEIFFHSTIGYKPHRFDQDVRRLLLQFLTHHFFGKVPLFSRAHDDSTRLRERTAKRRRLFNHVGTYYNRHEDVDTG